MKKFLLLIIPIALMISFIACDFSSEEEISNGNDSSVVSDKEGNSINNSENHESGIDVSNITDQDASSESNDSSVENDESSNTNDGGNSEVALAEKTIEGIKVKISGESQLKDSGFQVKSDFSMTVSVTLKGSGKDINSISESDIDATIDVSNVKESGEVELMIEYSAPDGVEIIAKSENFAKIEIEQFSAEVVPPVADDVRIVNGVLISGTRAMETFGGSASGGAKTAAMLNDFKKTMGDGVNVYVLPAPLASAFYAPEGYESSISRHQDCFYGVRDNLENVGFVDTLTALSAHVGEDLYFRTDHHWQALAAYYACEEFAKVAGVSFDGIGSFRVNSEDGVLGSFYTSYTHDAVLGSNPDTMVWYEPTREHTVEYYSREGHSGDPITGRSLFSTNSGYTKFVYGDSYTTHIKTNVGNGRKLLVFKDSYGNALAPFLVGSFDEIIIADYRYFKTDVSDFVAEQGITDVLFSLAAFKVNNCSAVAINY